MVANRMLQIQHTTGNLLLIWLNERLRRPDFLGSGRPETAENCCQYMEHPQSSPAPCLAELCLKGGIGSAEAARI